jgi:hypothetical protein
MSLLCYDHFTEEGCPLLALLVPTLARRTLDRRSLLLIILILIVKLSIILLLYSELMLANKNDKSIRYLLVVIIVFLVIFNSLAGIVFDSIRHEFVFNKAAKVVMHLHLFVESIHFVFLHLLRENVKNHV